MPRRSISGSLLLSLMITSISHAQNEQALTPTLGDAAVQLRIGRETIIPVQFVPQEQFNLVLDGRLDEAIWQQLEPINGHAVIEPETLAEPSYETQARIFYTDDGLYVGVDMEQPPETLVRRISGRDARTINRDRVSFTLDTSGAGLFGYWFSLALGDNQMDGTILPERRYSSEWDGAWYGATSETENGWSAEFFIPWGQLAMSDQGDTRYIGFYNERVVAHLNENWAWPAISRSDPVFLSSFPRLEFEDVEPTQQWSLFPYLSTTYDEVASDVDTQAGFDVFWRPSSNFQLTATVNPDFGSAESDNVVVNLTANETFFPEKRLFFQEGQEIFNTTPRSTGSGGKRLTIVNTRRIGGRPRAPDLPDGARLPATERIRPADLLGAAKMTAQSGNLRYGVLAAMEDETSYRLEQGRFDQDGRNFGAFRVIYEDSQNALYRGLGYIGTWVGHPDSDAQVHAVDFHYLNSSGRWNLDGQVITSDVDEVGSGYGGFADITYRPRQGLRHTLQLTYLDDKIEVNDFGFLDRNNVWEAWYRFEYIRTGLERVRDIRISPFIRYEENHDGDRTNNAIPVVSMDITLNNLDRVSLGLQHFPKRYDDQNSFGNGTFAVAERTNYNAEYTTDTARAVSVNAGFGVFEEFAGGTSYRSNAGVTWRPIDNINFNAEVRYEDRDGWLLHQRNQDFTAFDATQWRGDVSLEYFLTARQQLSAALQWVGIQAEEDRFYHLPADAPTRNRDLIRVDKPEGVGPDDFSLTQLNFQLRYRWQIAPLSDLFVVYTKNSNQRRDLIDFDDQFSNAWRDPLVDRLVVKLRYRFGT